MRGAADLFIAGDWGTSRLRLYLCASYGADRPAQILAETEGPGVKDTSDFSACFMDAVRLLPVHAPSPPVYLVGMAGSSLGWKETPYAPCPAGWRAFASLAERVHCGGYDIAILPGAACVNRFGLPDMMRGEETQLFGWLKGAERCPPLLACLPGTHVKWVCVDDGLILRFESSLQGELYDILNRYSILTRGAGAGASPEPAREAFRRGVALMRDQPDLSLSSAVFAVRSLQLARSLATEEAPAFLSGLLIGADIRDIARPLLAAIPDARAIALIGAQQLCLLYADALAAFGIAADSIDGRQAVVDGVALFHRRRAEWE